MAPMRPSIGDRYTPINKTKQEAGRCGAEKKKRKKAEQDDLGTPIPCDSLSYNLFPDFTDSPPEELEDDFLFKRAKIDPDDATEAEEQFMTSPNSPNPSVSGEIKA